MVSLQRIALALVLRDREIVRRFLACRLRPVRPVFLGLLRYLRLFPRRFLTLRALVCGVKRRLRLAQLPLRGFELRGQLRGVRRGGLAFGLCGGKRILRGL